MNIQVENVKAKLDEVMDPELMLAITDLGLVYDVKVSEDRKIDIKMTLTTIGCPLFNLIEQDIKDKMVEAGYKEEDVKIELTFEPPWSMERMSERAKAMLGI